MKSRTINNPIKEKKEISENTEIQHVIHQDKPFEKGIIDEKVDENLLINAIVKSYGSDDDKSIQLRATCHAVVAQYLREKSEEYVCAKKYNILLMYDESRIIRSDADKIYTAVTNFKNTNKPILLILFSAGGFAGSAYLISKLCREYTKGKFIVAVPRVAKSSATLLCCGADEIHMGSLSELGPIDPQIDELPALGLKHSIENIAELVNSRPNTAELFARYLNLSLPIINLGYYERVAESAKQYAVRLLTYNKDNLPYEPTKIAHELVYDYKDHGFVIDKTEAQQIFGEKIVKCNSPEYDLSNGIYNALDFIQSIAAGTNHKFYYIGSFDTEPSFAQLKK